MILNYESEKFQNSFARHTKSSAALVTTKKFSHTNVRAEYKDKIRVLEDDEENRKKFLDHVEEIKIKRKTEYLRSNSLNDLQSVVKPESVSYTHREKQQKFNQKRMEAVSKAQEKKEQIVVNKYRQNLFQTHRKSIESNIKIELKAIKIVRIWQEKRKARFMKIIAVKNSVSIILRKFLVQRNSWLNHIKMHLMSLRIQKHWKSFMKRRGVNIVQRSKKILKSGVLFYYNLNYSNKIIGKSTFVMKNFLENISTKIGINKACLDYCKKIDRIAEFIKS